MHNTARACWLAVILSGLLAPGCVVHTIESAEPDQETPASRPPPPRPPPSRPPPPPPSSWAKLAELSVDGKTDRDRLQLGAAEGSFRALQFKVVRSPMKMYDIVIHFTDGSSYSPTTKLVFQPGESRIVDLPGTLRTIRSIDFRYADMPGGGRAEVEVWGR